MANFIYKLFSEEQVTELLSVQKEIKLDYLERLEIDPFAYYLDDELIKIIETFLKQNEIDCNSILIQCIASDIYHESF